MLATNCLYIFLTILIHSIKVRLLFAEVICITTREDKRIEVERHLSHVSEADFIARFIQPSQKAITYKLLTQEIVEILFYLLDSLFEVCGIKK